MTKRYRHRWVKVVSLDYFRYTRMRRDSLDPNDVPLDFVVTENEIISTSRRINKLNISAQIEPVRWVSIPNG